MKRATRQWVRKAEGDLQVARDEAGVLHPVRDAVCFHCQQAAEKYLKALLQELGLPVPRTHDLEKLLLRLLPHDGTLGRLRRGLVTLSRYAVDCRYPGYNTTARKMHAALRLAVRARTELRARLGLSP
jgi:HEPN domain-containing protein